MTPNCLETRFLFGRQPPKGKGAPYGAPPSSSHYHEPKPSTVQRRPSLRSEDLWALPLPMAALTSPPANEVGLAVGVRHGHQVDTRIPTHLQAPKAARSGSRCRPMVDAISCSKTRSAAMRQAPSHAMLFRKSDFGR